MGVQQQQQQQQTHCAAPQQLGGRNSGRIRALFRKTELCSFYAKKRCVKGDTCRFAHGEEELNQVPDLTKTAMCRNWLKGTCTLTRNECPFAHGTGDLRRAAISLEQAVAAAGQPATGIAHLANQEDTTQAAGARSHEPAANTVATDPEPATGITHPAKGEYSMQVLHLAVHLFGAAPAPGGIAAGAAAAPAPLPSAAPGPDAGHTRRLTSSLAGAASVPPPCAVAIPPGWHVVPLQSVSPCIVPPAPAPVPQARGAFEEPVPQAHCLELLKVVVKRAAVSSDAELEALLLQAAPEHYED